MEIGEVFYPKRRVDWREWLQANHQSGGEIWVRRFIKASSEPTISYEDLIEECLCFGWIDGVIKKLDIESNVQRITLRRKKTFLSELNRQRIWKLQKGGLMTEAGVKPLADQIGTIGDPWSIPDWIEIQLKQDPAIWRNFESFPFHYQRLKIGWISEAGNSRQGEKQRRLDYLLKQTLKGKMYGTIPLADEKRGTHQC